MMREDQRPEARLASVSPVPGRAGYDDPLNSGRRSMTTQAPAELFGEVGDPVDSQQFSERVEVYVT